MSKKPKELTACFLAVERRIVSTHFACSASMSYDLLQLLSKHFDIFMSILLAPDESASGSVGWAEVHKVTSPFGLTAVLVLVPGSFEHGANHYWQGPIMLKQILQDFQILFRPRAALTHVMVGNPLARHEEGIVSGLDLLAMMALPIEELLEVNSIRELQHPLLEYRLKDKEQPQQVHHLQSGGIIATLKSSTANRPLKIAEVQTSFALYLISVIEGAHSRGGTSKRARGGKPGTTPMDKLRAFIDEVFKDNLGRLHSYHAELANLPNEVPRALLGSSFPVIVAGAPGTDKRLLPRQLVRVHHYCANRDLLEEVETVVHCLALANSRYLQQARLGVIISSEQTRSAAELIIQVRHMVREMTQAINELAEDALKNKIVEQWLIHMRNSRPFFEGAFSNFFTLERTVFQPDILRPELKDFHEWGTEDVPYFVNRWDPIMRKSTHVNDHYRARNFNSPNLVEKFTSTEGKTYSASVQDLDPHQDTTFPTDSIVFFHVPLALLNSEAVIQTHVACLNVALKGLPGQAVLALVFEKASSNAHVRSRFISRVAGFPEKAVEMFDVDFKSDELEIKRIFARCEAKRRAHVEAQERRRLEEIARIEQEANRAREEERKRDEAIKEELRRKEEELHQERRKRDEAEREAQRERFAIMTGPIRSAVSRAPNVSNIDFAFAPEAPSFDADGGGSNLFEGFTYKPEGNKDEPKSDVSAGSLLDQIKLGKALKTVPVAPAPIGGGSSERVVLQDILSRRLAVQADNDSEDGDDWSEDEKPAVPTKKESDQKSAPPPQRNRKASLPKMEEAKKARKKIAAPARGMADKELKKKDIAPSRARMASPCSSSSSVSSPVALDLFQASPSSPDFNAFAAAPLTLDSLLVSPPPPPAPSFSSSPPAPSLVPLNSPPSLSSSRMSPPASPLTSSLASPRPALLQQSSKAAHEPVQREMEEEEMQSYGGFEEKEERAMDDYDVGIEQLELGGREDLRLDSVYGEEAYSMPTSNVYASEAISYKSAPKKSGGGAGGMIVVGLVCCFPCIVAAAPVYTLFWVGKKMYEKAKDVCEDWSDRWKNRKKNSSIDDVFADMENVFNGLASCVLYCEVDPHQSKAPAHRQAPCCCFFSWSATSTLSFLVVSVPLLIIIYTLVSAFAVSILLPCIFVLLVVRTAKVERKVDTGFAVRQQVLASESKAKKALRGVSLLLRAIPMLGLVVVYPLIAVYLIAAENRDSAKIAIGIQLTLLAVLQVLGSVRGMKSWIEANKEKDQVRVVKQMGKLDRDHEVPPGMLPHWVQAVTDEHADLGDDDLRAKLALEAEPLADFKLAKPSNWVVAYGVLMEGVQLAFFAIEFAPGSGGYDFTNAIFLRLNVFVPEELIYLVDSSAILISCACVALLIVLFCIQLIKEVRRFGLLKRSGDSKGANAFFFYSFVGAIIYGHGEVRGVNRLVSSLAAILSDALFLIIASHLLSALVCSPAAPLLPTTQCWEGADLHRAALALIALSFYVPLCVMIGPMLAEASSDKPQPPAVKLAQPFLSVIAVSKFFLLLFAAYFAQGTAAATKPILALIVCLLVFLVLLGWAFRSGTTLLPSKTSPRIPGLQVPINPPSLFIWRTLCYAAGVWGAVSALVVIGVDNAEVDESNSTPSEDIKGIVFFIGLAGIFITGFIWWMRWKTRDRVQRHRLAVLALMLQGKKPIDADMTALSGRKVPVTTQQLKPISANRFDSDCLVVDGSGCWSVLTSN